ncbi:uncharacterized protein B0J16DRAFT_159769 [Fusarium flagelliforme]|uniref:Uncharacterized protein n=1 Tax=Fusarium flagelliforme TaxID=2675880 RepID=A0A395M8D6_9HYPO|nr:uncharacterized protein B0J16DRAFT_159769 [Fusarium flagelliforme]KAH7183019.1 hypothetical protein B0J16DRAFT_159769 [Fusarium flagelliforme]RFN44145.1 hypothetical protein FIE12Z_11612 [Fusarium flagelliforme]
MPLFNPLNLVCCCKSRWGGSGSGDPVSATHDMISLQQVPALDFTLEERQRSPEQEQRNTLIGLSDVAWAVPERQSSIDTDSITNQHSGSDSFSDSFDSDLGRPRAKNKSSTTFGVVRNRLIRSISHNTSSDQPSRVSVGNSEEEVARRAELRRIMRLRIQDQLESEEAEDQFENKTTRSIRRAISSVDLAFPTSGPRDAIEFGVTKSALNNGQPARLDPDHGGHGTCQSFVALPKNATVLERASQEASGAIGHEEDIRGYHVLQKPSSTHLSAHISEDTALPFSQKSFQLSNGAGRLDRILGLDNSFNSRQASSRDSQSALGVWLIAQGLRSRDNSNLFLEEEEQAGSTSPTGKIEDIPSIAKRGQGMSACELEPMSTKGDCLVIQRPTPNSSPNRLKLHGKLKPGYVKDGHDTLNFPGELPWGPTVRALLGSFTDNTSSGGPSKSPPSPVRSQKNLYKLELKDLESMELSPFRWRSQDSPRDEGNSDDESHKPPDTRISHSKSQSQGVVGGFQSEAEMMHDTASLAQSESPSFLQREAELQTIERRFSEALTQRKPEKVVPTRFLEHFSHPAPRPPVEKPSKNKTHLAVPKGHQRAKSEGSLYRHVEYSLGLPRAQRFLLIPLDRNKTHRKEASDRSKRRSNLSIRPHMSRLPTEEYVKSSLEPRESATDLWQRAVRLEAERRHYSSFLSMRNPDGRSIFSYKQPKEQGARNSSSSISDARREISQLTPSTEERSSPSNSKWLIERWVSQMRPRSTHQADSVTSVKLVSPPKSWSKFPSFNREERNKNAAPGDKVQPRDFAVKHVTSEGQIRWATDMTKEDEQRVQTLSRSMSTKFGGLFKSKMNRIMPSKSLRRRMSHAFIARTPSTAQMEYPEMGIRPSESGYTELQALGREISNMKGQAHLQTSGQDISKPQSSGRLGDRVVALLHEAVGQKHRKPGELLESADIPIVPGTPSVVRPSIGATTTDVFVTPKSHFSNDGESKGDIDELDASFTTAGRYEARPRLFDNDGASSYPVLAAPTENFDSSIRSLPANKT